MELDMVLEVIAVTFVRYEAEELFMVPHVSKVWSSTYADKCQGYADRCSIFMESS